MPEFRAKILLVLCFSFFQIHTKAQNSAGLPKHITYAEHIHPIIRQHCQPCHQPGQAAPFSLLGYSDVKLRAKFILYVVENKVMPPWPADPNYRGFMNEKKLSPDEISLIRQWVQSGMVPGDTAHLKKFAPSNLYKRRKPDYVFFMPQKFTIEPGVTDHYLRIRVTSNMEADVDVAGFEFVPGNLKAVHHTELLARPARKEGSRGTGDTLDFFITETYSNEGGSVFRGYEYVTGWLPGNDVEIFPEGVAKKISRNEEFIFLMHYPPSPIRQEDSTVLYVYKTKSKPERYMKSIDLHAYECLVNGPLVIPADSVKTFHSIKKVEEDASAFAIMAHAHHLCKKMLAYAVTPEGDTIPLLRINEWYFGWQYQYRFPHYVKLPAGSVVHFFATYDNTIENPENPFNPPREVRSSFNANDEMMELFIFIIPYRRGDENAPISYEIEGF